ncbi:hypothetical protein DIURU_004341 [Diutina rugosa]|uniref:DNA-directed RNA polymerase subunit n=1 Tax=Diutina rugosa TaxID=5481 RepID=A0A642UPI8_DIURU|nr:uncharacterized protein DIURU_004341 [Diutina rugosa]KAA8899319.1 hypothetical protein DIURU_004341 [Diutina rugosa]
MDIGKPVGASIASVDFGVMSDEEIRRLSAKQVTNPVVFDNLGHPIQGGLYDLALGAFLRHQCHTCGLDEKFCPGHLGHIELPVVCYNPMFFKQMYLFLRASCVYCHHFKMSAEQKHLVMCKLKLLQYGLVRECDIVDGIGAGSPDDVDEEGTGIKGDTKKVMALREDYVARKVAKATPVQTSTLIEERKRVISDFFKRLIARGKCDNCGMFSPSFRNDGYSKLFENSLTDAQLANNRVKGLSRPQIVKGGVSDITVRSKGSKYVLSTEVHGIIQRVFQQEQQVLSTVFHSRPSDAEVSGDMFFRKALVVPPTRFRLPSKLGDEIHENAQNASLSEILQTALNIRDLNELIATSSAKELSAEVRKQNFNRLMNNFVKLQNDVNTFMDSTKAQSNGGKLPNPGVKQALEKKEGLFRKHMMGKRVNFAARSVISPDPNLETNEIGVPPVFAHKLTYPEPVTTHNVAELRQCVINGPEKWPGAMSIQNEDGSMVSLLGMTLEQRKAAANQLMTPSGPAQGVKKVLRHIRNGDVVLMNRQPTLHKASMMGHKVRVLPGEKTLRLHYANTGAYNADFDGDEMNMHFPQNENARAEAYNLANTDSQYLTPTSGSPLRGLIQDHISAGVWLTSKDSFFTRDQYQQLVYSCIRPEDGHTLGAPRIRTLPPTIIKPQPLWTGKQVISTVLLNIVPHNAPGLNLKSKNKVKNELWGVDSEENTVIFHKGLLVCGILDKSQYGAQPYGMVHSIHEVYGPTTAGAALSVLGRLFTNYIMQTAFTCGMDDLRLTDDGNNWRQEILKKGPQTGRDAALEVTNLTAEDSPKELRRRLEEILRDDSKLGILDAITQNKVNQITSEVVGKCIPDGTMKKFPYNSMQAMATSGAKGSNVNVSQIMCLLGQQALEGRRVPVMVSGKTLPSFKPFETDSRAGGYIKQRFYSGIRPQEYYFHCMAGREGLIDTAVKTSRSGYLQRCLTKQLEGVHVSYDDSVRDGDGQVIQFLYGGDAVDVTKQSHMHQFQFCLDNYDGLLNKYQPGEAIEHLDVETAVKYSKKARKHLKKEADLPVYAQSDKYDPVLSVYSPSRYLGSVSESFAAKLDDFIAQNPQFFEKGVSPVSEKKFRAMMALKYMRSVVHPGEAVGIIASQSIGEPSTQMTLNTFHFAGHGAANVTLGIPRMREIIMTASAAIKTPQMSLHLLPDINSEMADSFCKSVTRVTLGEFIDSVSVTETTSDGARSYQVQVKFYTKAEYEKEYDISQAQLEHTVQGPFLQKLETEIVKQLKKASKKQPVEVGQSAGKIDLETVRSSGKDDDDDIDAEDTSKKQAVSYDGPDDDEVEIMQKAEASDAENDDDEPNSGSDSDSDADDVDMDAERSELSKSAKERQSAVIGHTNYVTAFDFDDAHGEWCSFSIKLRGKGDTLPPKLLMVNIIEDTCRASVVREIPHIQRCVRDPSDPKALTTEGVNFRAMWDEDEFIDVDKITSNDVAAVLKTYGVEAARNTIVNEIYRVFDTYGISVSSRHLDLIGDMMTRQGNYLAFNRQGIDSSTSAFMKMSYETTCQFLTKAVLDGDREQLQSPSAKIVLGKVADVGTGSFDLLARVQ